MNEVIKNILTRRSIRTYKEEQISDEHPNAMADSAVALENILLAAHSLGLGACYINQLRWFTDDKGVRKVLGELGIPDNYMVCCSAAIGYNSGPIPKAAPRREGTVDIIR